jgi:alpha-L-rhamnosidase
MKNSAERIYISEDPYLQLNVGKNWVELGLWPAHWVGCVDATQPPFVCAYRRKFKLEKPGVIHIHVTADERYELFLDGERIGRGSERGTAEMWFYESYALSMEAGEHTLVARVWALGDMAPDAQASIRPGFLLAADAEWQAELSTGVAERSEWEAKRLDGYSFTKPSIAHWKGANITLRASQFGWGYERGEGDGWKPVYRLEQGVGRRISWELPPVHVLHPATLLAMMDAPRQVGKVRFVGQVPAEDLETTPVDMSLNLVDETGWQDLLAGRAYTVPAHTRRRIIIDLENYYCAYPELVVSGGEGGLLRLFWAESLYEKAEKWSHVKGNRGDIDGKYFRGKGDVFYPDGNAQRNFTTLWWESGRYIELYVQTAYQPLTISKIAINETRYPLEMQSEFSSSDAKLDNIQPIMVRTMQMCSHETFFDCPYYEEMQYSGDTRLEMLTTYIMTRDDRLPRKAMRLYDFSRQYSGQIQSRFPAGIQHMQIIAPFSLWWVGMVPEYAYWRDDRDYVDSLMPGVRATLEGFRRLIGKDGLLYAAEGWNTIDWVPEWGKDAGVPPDGMLGASGLLNWQYIYTLTLIADLEGRLGEHELAARNRRLAAEMASQATAAFWDERRGILADERNKQCFSEHTQVMALLSGQLRPEIREKVAEGLFTQPDLSRTTIYFSHYYFEVCRLLGRMDKLFERMALWYYLQANDFKTTVESPEPSRSDCHAWAAHPLFHYFATLLGIRPASLGFKSVEIAPQLGSLSHASGKMVHPQGWIEVDFHMEGNHLHGSVVLPESVNGVLRHNGFEMTLKSGKQEF